MVKSIGILTKGGTILGTGRDKVHKMDVGGESMDMSGVMLDTFNEHQLEAIVCLGGGADAIMIPEIPYSIDLVAESIRNRRTARGPFSIVR